MFKNHILPINSEVEKLHLKFCKRVLGVHSKSTNIAVFGELGRTPLIFQIAKLVIKYWNQMSVILKHTGWQNSKSMYGG